MQSRFMTVLIMFIVLVVMLMLASCVSAPADTAALFTMDKTAHADARGATIEDAAPAEILRAARTVMTASGYHITLSQPQAGLVSAEQRILVVKNKRSTLKKIARLLAAPLTGELLPLARAYTQRVSVYAVPAGDDDTHVTFVLWDIAEDADGGMLHQSLHDDATVYRGLVMRIRNALFAQRQGEGV